MTCSGEKAREIISVDNFSKKKEEKIVSGAFFPLKWAINLVYVIDEEKHGKQIFPKQFFEEKKKKLLIFLENRQK